MVSERLLNHTIFQSTHPREGVRQIPHQHIPDSSRFQSTHPREGVRPRLVVLGGLRILHFNPRTPAKECDLARRLITPLS